MPAGIVATETPVDAARRAPAGRGPRRRAGRAADVAVAVDHRARAARLAAPADDRHRCRGVSVGPSPLGRRQGGREPAGGPGRPADVAVAVEDAARAPGLDTGGRAHEVPPRRDVPDRRLVAGTAQVGHVGGERGRGRAPGRPAHDRAASPSSLVGEVGAGPSRACGPRRSRPWRRMPPGSAQLVALGQCRGVGVLGHRHRPARRHRAAPGRRRRRRVGGHRPERRHVGHRQPGSRGRPGPRSGRRGRAAPRRGPRARCAGPAPGPRRGRRRGGLRHRR